MNQLDWADWNRPEPTGPTDRNWTDQNRTDQNWTDQTDGTRLNQTGPTGPDRTGVTSAEQRLPIKDEVSRIRHQGSRTMDHGSWIMGQRSWIKDLGPCSGTDDHPGRDSGVRSRPSNSTIKDISFYIDFTRIEHLGPCFGMNGHLRRATDVISRLHESIIDFLSV